MALPPFRKQQPKVDSEQALERTLRQMQDASDDAFRRVLAVSMLDGVKLSSVTISASGTTVDHGLDRAPVGWLVTDVTSGYNKLQRTAWDDKTISLINDSSAFTGDLWVF